MWMVNNKNKYNNSNDGVTCVCVCVCVYYLHLESASGLPRQRTVGSRRLPRKYKNLSIINISQLHLCVIIIITERSVDITTSGI